LNVEASRAVSAFVLGKAASLWAARRGAWKQRDARTEISSWSLCTSCVRHCTAYLIRRIDVRRVDALPGRIMRMVNCNSSFPQWWLFAVMIIGQGPAIAKQRDPAWLSGTNSNSTAQLWSGNLRLPQTGSTSGSSAASERV